jgi:hypothetical protein
VIVFFDAVIERRFSDADKALEEVRGKRKANPEFQEGYMKALEETVLKTVCEST